MRTLSLIVVTFTYLLIGAAIFDVLEGNKFTFMIYVYMGVGFQKVYKYLFDYKVVYQLFF